ncbi:hypothetical protein [Paracandidimonas lactea]|uniref:hypothetical protein n=1 Tax=Paracandidimonas lactea TaxID=2895524 RepID=UPI0019262D59|nr:hypothetical protein [Paracandidimonas lactea]
MKARNTWMRLVLAGVLTATLAGCAVYRDDYYARRNNNAVLGAGIGAAAGAVASDGDPVYILGGAAAGGLLGTILTEDRRYYRGWDRDRDHYYDRGYYRDRDRYYRDRDRHYRDRDHHYRDGNRHYHDRDRSYRDHRDRRRDSDERHFGERRGFGGRPVPGTGTGNHDNFNNN